MDDGRGTAHTGNVLDTSHPPLPAVGRGGYDRDPARTGAIGTHQLRPFAPVPRPLVLHVRTAIPVLDLRPGDAVLIDTSHREMLWRRRDVHGRREFRPIGAWAYGVIAGELADGRLLTPDDAPGAAPLSPSRHRRRPGLRLVP